MSEFAGSELRETPGELDCRRVREAREHHVLQRSELLHQRRVDARVAVPEQVDPPRADRVEDAAAFEIVDPEPFGATDLHERQRFVGLHLRSRMPAGTQAPLHNLPLPTHSHTPYRPTTNR